MRITTSIDDSLAHGGAAARAQERLRWAFGTYAPEITSVRLKLRPSGDDVAAELEVRYRSGAETVLVTEGRDLDDVVAFLARRARAAVARRLAAEKLGVV